MKFSTSALLAVLLTSVAVADNEGHLAYHDGFFNEDQVDAYVTKFDEQMNQDPSKDGVLGWVPLADSLQRKIQDLAGTCVALKEREDSLVPLFHLTGSTKSHQDRYLNMRLVEEPVGFAFLNTNPDAAFVYEKEGEEIRVPVQAGRWVQFDGRVPHHTFVEKGNVKLLGPIDTASFSSVGKVPPSTPTCTSKPFICKLQAKFCWYFGLFCPTVVAVGRRE